MNWINLKVSGPPKNRYTTDHLGNIIGQRVSLECIVTDGEDVFVDYCDKEMYENGFHPSITHYIVIEDIDLPKQENRTEKGKS